MHFEAPDRFATALGRTEIERGVFGWVVCPGLGQCLDGMVDLSWVREAQTRPTSTSSATSCRRSRARA